MINNLIHRVRRRLGPPFASYSFAQEGEDMVLGELLESPAERMGFYVDVGAHHPQRFSNTYRFYLMGWRGINIEPNPDIIARFQSQRPRDINLSVGCADEEADLVYYQFNESALNTFSKATADRRVALQEARLMHTKKVHVRRLAGILEEHLPPSTKLDFLTVDVEDLDIEVLRSNDWKRFRPSFVLAEDLGSIDSLEQIGQSPVVQFMKEQSYKIVAKGLRTLYFKEMTGQ